MYSSLFTGWPPLYPLASTLYPLLYFYLLQRQISSFPCWEEHLEKKKKKKKRKKLQFLLFFSFLLFNYKSHDQCPQAHLHPGIGKCQNSHRVLQCQELHRGSHEDQVWSSSTFSQLGHLKIFFPFFPIPRQPGQSSKDDVSEKNFKEELLRKEQANSDKMKKTLARTAGGSYSNIGKIGLDIVAE